MKKNSFSFFFLFLVSCSGVSAKITPEQELGASQATASWLESHFGLVESQELQVFIQRITKRLAKGAQTIEEGKPEYRTYNWSLTVLDSPEPNAFSIGSGMLFITKGLIQRTPSEAALAAVIAHEMSHQILGHSTHALLQATSPKSQPSYSYSLPVEIAADEFGLKILQAARYDIRNALQSLYIGYRQTQRVVSQDKWLAMRTANLLRHIGAARNYLPATGNSREYSRIRRALLSRG